MTSCYNADAHNDVRKIHGDVQTYSGRRVTFAQEAVPVRVRNGKPSGKEGPVKTSHFASYDTSDSTVSDVSCQVGINIICFYLSFRQFLWVDISAELPPVCSAECNENQ